MNDIVNEFLEKTREPLVGLGREMLKIRPRIVCADGFEMSVQAGWTHYCSPRIDNGPYSSVEVGYPSEREELLMPHVEGEGDDHETVYPFTPIEVVIEVIKKHGGMRNDEHSTS